MNGQIPATIISGYLGSGKTTLINSLLRRAEGRRLAILVNDFGELAIDAELIEAREGNLLSISGGCICCSFGNDLVAALLELCKSGLPVDHFLIEASGVALPIPIAQSMSLVNGVLLDAIVTLADAETVRQLAADRYVGDTVRDQLAAADMLVLNKTDLVSSQQLSSLQKWARASAPRARILSTRNADLSPLVVLGEHETHVRDYAARQPWIAHEIIPYETVRFETNKRADLGSLARALTEAGRGVLRAKGVVENTEGEFFILHVVGRRSHIEPAPARLNGPSRLSCIGLAGEMSPPAIQELIAQNFI